VAVDHKTVKAWTSALPRVWQVLAPYLRPLRWHLALTAAGSALVSLSVMPVLWLLRLAFDRAIPQGDSVLLLEIGLGVVAIRLLTMTAALGLRRQVIRAVKEVVLHLRIHLLERVYTRSREGMSRTEIDRLHSRIVQESERLDVFCNAMFSQVLPAVWTALAVALFLATQSPSLVLISALVLPGLWFAGRLTQRRVAREVESFQSAFEVFNKGVSFVIRLIDLTRTQGHEKAELQRQNGHLRDLSAAGQRMAWSFALHGQLQTLVTGIAGIVLLVIGGWQVTRGTLSLGDLLVFYFGATMLNGALGTISRSAAEILAARASVEKLAPLLAPDAAPGYEGTAVIDFRGGFSLRGIQVRFERQQVLHGVDLDIAPGERLAIVGPNGSGKSTLLHVLLGLLRPQAGQARADGMPYDNLDTSALRRQIGVVPQRAGFFFGTVFDNVSYGHPEATLDEVRVAARLAGAADFVEGLPQGYDTPIGDGGQALSGGECQRLAIARALLHRPRALVLDEPTNHLDVAAVGELLQQLAALPNAPTIILVSHDRRVLQMVDRTYRMQDGRLHANAGASQSVSMVG
jgi:ATP-binding cassette, subfamily B, bacterial